MTGQRAYAAHAERADAPAAVRDGGRRSRSGAGSTEHGAERERQRKRGGGGGEARHPRQRIRATVQRVARACAAVAVLALALVSGAAADGDPASDVLLTQNAFFPSPAPSAGAQQDLNQAIAVAYAKSYRV